MQSCKLQLKMSLTKYLFSFKKHCITLNKCSHQSASNMLIDYDRTPIVLAANYVTKFIHLLALSLNLHVIFPQEQTLEQVTVSQRTKPLLLLTLPLLLPLAHWHCPHCHCHFNHVSIQSILIVFNSHEIHEDHSCS